MTDVVVQPVGGLSEGERLVDTFVAPSKTFTDIRRKATWWLPFVIMCLFSVIFVSVVDKKVGFDTITQTNIEKNKFAAERMESLSPDQRAAAIGKQAKITRITSYCFVGILLIWALFISLLWWLTANFALGASLRYGQVLAIFMYSALPKVLVTVIAIILLMAGVGTENFDMQMPAGTSLGYYIPTTSPVLRAAGGFLDVFGIWSLILATLGIAIVAGKSKGKAAIVVFGWWFLGLILTVAGAAFTSSMS